MTYFYCSRESVMRAPDIRASAYVTGQVDEACAHAAVMVDKLCHLGAPDRGIPGFLPWTGTLSFDWPNEQGAESGRFWLDNHTLISLASFTSGGTAVPIGNVLLEPAADGPPYRRLELDRATSSAFNTGSGTGQRSLSLAGVYGLDDVRTTTSGLTVNGNVSAGATAMNVNGPVSVGDTLVVDSERMRVVEKSWITSAQTGSLTASAADQSLTVSDGSGFRPGEELLIDAERLLVRDVAGNVVFVQRAYGGTPLAAHTAAAVYWPRALTVERAVLGTTAAAHTSLTAVWVQQVQAPVRALARAYALNTFYQEGSGYARTVGSEQGERPVSGRAIKDLEEQVYGAYGRRYRARAV